MTTEKKIIKEGKLESVMGNWGQGNWGQSTILKERSTRLRYRGRK